MFPKKQIVLLLFATVFTTGGVLAQAGGKGITNEEVIVVKEYEVTIPDADKVNLQPNIPEVEDSKPKLDYTVPQKGLRDFAFETSPLKPLSISKEKLEKYHTSFIKAGFGSQIMPLAQLAYNDNKTKDLNFGFFYNYLSAREFKVKNQRFSDNQAGVYLKWYPKSVVFGTRFNFRNYRTHFYGTDSIFRAKDVAQTFRTYDAKIYLQNAKRNKYDINFSQLLGFNYLQETFGKANEWFVEGRTDLDKKFKKFHTISFSFNFDISRLKNDSLILRRHIFTPKVGYKFNNDDWRGHADLGVAVDSSKVVFVTEAYLEKRLYEQSIIAYTSFERRYQKNSLNAFATDNNFVQNSISIRNSTIDHFTAGIKGTIDKFNYKLGFDLNRIKNLPLYVNDTMDMKRFVMIYEANMRTLGFHGEAGYNIKEWLRLLAVADYQFYQMKTETRPWHQPNFRFTLRANYVWKNKIVVGLDLFATSHTYAKLSIEDGGEKKVKGTADLNLSLEYILTKSFSFFGNLNNIANIRYQRWNQYQSYGINGMVGAKFSF
ncbi:MAG: TonB-dependent receptor [Bacteroidetes bacterium]|nr:TonB-dependent receptor [Bacteroidota bacterium]